MPCYRMVMRLLTPVFKFLTAAHVLVLICIAFFTPCVEVMYKAWLARLSRWDIMHLDFALIRHVLMKGLIIASCSLICIQIILSVFVRQPICLILMWKEGRLSHFPCLSYISHCTSSFEAGIATETSTPQWCENLTRVLVHF